MGEIQVSRAKRIKKGLARLIVLAFIGTLAAIAFKVISFDETAWSVFINAKAAQILVMVLVVIAPQAIADWISEGETIKSILECDREGATWQDRGVAALYLVGLGLASVLAVTRGAF